jgi:hypothetical protein
MVGKLYARKRLICREVFRTTRHVNAGWKV